MTQERDYIRQLTNNNCHACFLFVLSSIIYSVEVPATVVSVHDGDTITVQVDGRPQRVRLLWIDTPEVSDNRHGQARPEGARARDLVRELLPKGQAVVLWGPGEELERDPFKRVLAVVWAEREGLVGAAGSTAAPTKWQENVNLQVVRAGLSPYWRKYGTAPGDLHKAFTEAQEQAREAGAGAWGTAHQYMIDKSNETTRKVNKL